MPIKPEDALEILGFTDLSKFEDTDTFKEAVEKDWVKKASAASDPDVQQQVMSTKYRVGRKRLGDLAKTLGVDVDDELLKSGDLLDIIPKVNEAVKPVLEDLNGWKAKAEKAVPDDVVKEWQGKLKTAEKERDAFKGQAVEWQEKYNGLDTEVKTSKRKGIVDGEWNAALGGIQFHQGVDDLKRKGFVAAMKEKYRIDIDDEFKPRMVDASGNPVKHPKKAGEMLGLAEAIKQEAATMKLLGENPHGGKPVTPAAAGQRTPSFTPQAPTPPPAPQRRIAPRMV